MEDRYFDLAEATAFVLAHGGERSFDSPRRFLAHLTDVMDPDCDEMLVLERNCDEGLLRLYRAALAGDSGGADGAEARARDYLVSECRIDSTAAAAVASGIAEGVARHLAGTSATQRTGQEKTQVITPGPSSDKSNFQTTDVSSAVVEPTAPQRYSKESLHPVSSPSSQGQGPATASNAIGISAATISQIPDQPFTGRPVTPRPVVSVRGTTLSYGTDYLLSYRGNVGSQTRTTEATVTITGTGAYAGSCTTTFRILPPAAKGASLRAGRGATANDISTATIGRIPDQRFADMPIYPQPTVTLGGKTLSYGTDYLLAYRGNTGSADRETEATVTITGTGTYAGSCTTTFKILPPISMGATSGAWRGAAMTDISAATIGQIPDQHFAGKPIYPQSTIALGGKTLSYGTDYLLSYRGNVGSQTRTTEATVTVTGTGAYAGSCTTTFRILPPVARGSRVGGAPSSSWR